MTRWEIERAVLASDLSPSTRHLMLTIAVYVDWKTATTPREHTPSLTVLAAATGYTRRGIMQMLNRLERDGWIIRQRPPIEKSRRGARTRYQLATPRDTQIPTVGNHHSLGVGNGEHKPREPGFPQNQTTTDINQPGLALVAETLEFATGKKISIEDARRAVAFAVNGRPVRDPIKYTIAAIRDEDSDPRRFLPTPTPPPVREVLS